MKIYWSEFFHTYLFLENDIVFLMLEKECIIYNCIETLTNFTQLEFICEVTDE